MVKVQQQSGCNELTGNLIFVRQIKGTLLFKKTDEFLHMFGNLVARARKLLL